MISSKVTAAKFLQEFRRISQDIGNSLNVLPKNSMPYEERKAVCKPVGELLGAILCDIYYPIVALHPELRPVELLGHEAENSTYRIVCSDHTGHERIIKSDVLVSDAYRALDEYSGSEAVRVSGEFCWLELEDKKPLRDKKPNGGGPAGVR